MQMMTVLFDLTRNPDDDVPMPEAPHPEVVDMRQLARDSLTGLASGMTRSLGRGARNASLAALRAVRNPVGAARDSVALAASVYRTAGPLSDTLSPMMAERATTRQLAMLDVSLMALRAAARTEDATVNAAYLAALTGGLRRYHEHHSAAVDELRVTMPISLRTDEDEAWGNRITLQRLTLPVAEADPAVRMRRIHDITIAAQQERSLPVTDSIAVALNVLPAGYVGGVLKHVDFLASDVRGSSVPIFLAGAEVKGFFTFGPTIGAALNATLVSHLGVCDIGVNIDTAAVPDYDVMMQCLEEGFAEVAGLGTAPTKSTSSRRVRRA
jgi:hypothetical protein